MNFMGPMQVTNVHALETLGKIKEIDGYVRVTLDKLPDIRADMVRSDDDWQDWGFSQMIEALRKWYESNPVGPEDQKYKSKLPKDKSFQANQGDWKLRPCIYLFSFSNYRCMYHRIPPKFTCSICFV
jgi:hypothetical protein